MTTMNLHRLKIEHSNAITAKLANEMTTHEMMIKHYAVNFMESESDSDKEGYRTAKIEHDTMKRAIEIVQRVSRDFEFKEDEK